MSFLHESHRPSASKHGQRVRALGQRPEQLVKPKGARDQHDVVRQRPRYPKRDISWTSAERVSEHCAIITTLTSTSASTHDALPNSNAHPTPNARKAQPVTEAVRQHTAVQITGPQIDEGGKDAEERGVGELEEGLEQADEDD